jgi:mRNA interferase RelE/StbE
MQTIETRKYQKRLIKLPAQDQLAVIDALDAIEEATTFADIPNLKALQGYKNYFRLRVGNWRVGLFWNGTAFIVEDIGKRGDFYNHYP